MRTSQFHQIQRNNSKMLEKEDGTRNNLGKMGAGKRRDKRDRGFHPIKIVVRHLPPTMTEKEFLEQVDPLPEHASFVYCTPDWSLGQEATCRAYIYLKDNEAVMQFSERFDGYVFVDTKGAEYVAIVEYAPFQCFTKNKDREDDSKANTIENDIHFQEFLTKLLNDREEASRAGDVKTDFLFDLRDDEKVKSTPLLEYLAKKKEKRREEMRKRNEDKRKHRDEQKLRQKERENEKAKDKSGEGKNSGGNKSINEPSTDAKSTTSRSKRKLMRERERSNLSQTENKNKGGRNEKLGKENIGTKSAAQYKQGKRDRNKPQRDIAILKKEKNPDKNIGINKGKSISAKAVGGDGIARGVTTNTNENAVIDTGNINDIVQKFIRAAVSCKDSDRSLVGENGEGSTERAESNDKPKQSSKRGAMERRIRNKDRPSIAIYQPKSKSMEDKDAEQSPIPDAEPSVANEQYRNATNQGGKRYRKKPDYSDKIDYVRRASKSSESSTSASSKIS